AGRGLHDRLVRLRKLVPLWQIDDQVIGRAAFPPTGIIIIFCDLIEAQLLVIIRTYPFGGIDRALLQCRIDVTASNLLRYDAELAERFSGPTANAHLETSEVSGLLDFLVEPPAHLTAGIPHQQAFCVGIGGKLIDQFLTVARVEPSILLARIEAERHRTEQRPGRILANIVVLRAVPHFDGAVLYGI